MLIAARINTYNSEFKNLTDEQFAELVAAIPGLPGNKKEVQGWTSYVFNHEAMRVAAKYKLTIELDDVPDHKHLMLVKLQDKIAELELRSNDLASQIVHGAAVHVHIPDLALMVINEVTYMEDACTDALQSELDDGWRILAVCPPNAQRRPDYILGRVKTEQEKRR